MVVRDEQLVPLVPLERLAQPPVVLLLELQLGLQAEQLVVCYLLLHSEGLPVVECYQPLDLG